MGFDASPNGSFCWIYAIHFIMLTPSRKLLGFARWYYPYLLTNQQAKQKEASEKISPSLPQTTNAAMLEEFFAQEGSLRIKWINHEKDFCKISRFCYYLVASRRGRVVGWDNDQVFACVHSISSFLLVAARQSLHLSPTVPQRPACPHASECCC